VAVDFILTILGVQRRVAGVLCDRAGDDGEPDQRRPGNNAAERPDDRRRREW
jgi:hypothetical protein